MAYSINEYFLKDNLTIHGIQGIPIQLDNTMFIHSGTTEVLPSNQFPNYLYAISSTVANAGGYITVINPSGSPSFSLASGHPQTIPITAKSSIQKPISISNIKTTLGVTINDIDGLCKSSAINPLAQYKPNSAEPNSFSEWLNYCHTTETGVTINTVNSTTFAPLGTTTCYFNGTVIKKDLISSDYDLSKGIKMTFGEYSTLYNTSTFNYYSDVAGSTLINYIPNGTTTIPVNAYMKKFDNNWYNVGSTYYTIYKEYTPTMTVNYANYSGHYFYVNVTINNGLINPHYFELMLSIYNGNTWQISNNSSSINSNSSVTETETFYFSTHTINVSSDLFTLYFRKTGDTTWATYCSNVSYSYFPSGGSVGLPE